MSGDFEPDKFEEQIRRRQAGLPAPNDEATAQRSNVTNLMDALRRTIAAA
jgi:hypothetical protein